jgi:hypothetical protein
MKIVEHPIEFYIKKLQNQEYFSFPGFSDSEWFCMNGNHIGEKSAAGQLHTKYIGQRLKRILQNPTWSPNTEWMPAVPSVIHNYSEIEEFNLMAGDQTFYERDIVTDDLAAQGGLAPLIKQLREMDVYIVSNVHLKGLFFLKYKKFFELDSVFNFHQDLNALDDKIMEIMNFGKPGVYLFSAGVSAAVMIGELHGKINDAFLIDCGSIWDAFVGMGGHRTWREELYNDPVKWVEWLNKNLDV